MAFRRYMGGVGIIALGAVILIFGFLSFLVYPPMALVLMIIGFILLIVGKFYAGTAMRYTPVKIEREVVLCPKCRHRNDSKAKFCVKCGKKI